MGDLHLCRREPAEAERVQRKAIEVLDQLLADFPTFDWAWSSLAGCYRGLAAARLSQGSEREAENALRHAISITEEHVYDAEGWGDWPAWMRFELGQLLWWTDRREEAYAYLERAQSDLDSLVQRAPRQPLYPQSLAIMLVTCPDERLRDVPRAIQLAAQTLHPDDGRRWQLLGVARYRAGDWLAAREALTEGARLRRGGDAFDFFLLAMANHRLGDQPTALDWYARALKH